MIHLFHSIVTRKATPVLAAMALACTIFSCQSSPKPEDTATDFLKAYLSTDYIRAASFCTKDLSDYLNEAVKELDNLNSEVKSQIQKHTQYYTPQIHSVKKNTKGDTVVVHYSIMNANPEDTLNNGSQIIENVLSLVKEEDHWKVAGLNNM